MYLLVGRIPRIPNLRQLEVFFEEMVTLREEIVNLLETQEFSNFMSGNNAPWSAPHTEFKTRNT